MKINYILCLTSTVTSVRILEEDACHRAQLCVFSHVKKGTPGLMHKGCISQRVSVGALSDVTVVLGMRQSIVCVDVIGHTSAISSNRTIDNITKLHSSKYCYHLIYQLIYYQSCFVFIVYSLPSSYLMRLSIYCAIYTLRHSK